VRRLRALVALGVPLAVLTAAPASASEVTGPGTVTEHGTFTVSGVIDDNDRTGVAELRLVGPDYDRAVARSTRPSVRDPRADQYRVSYGVATAPCTLPGASFCSGGGVLPNGRWAVRLFEVDRPPNGGEVERGQSAGGGQPFTVLVDVPALAPQDVDAVLSGRTVTVTWARGVGPDRSLVEPDVRWSVSDGVARSQQVVPSACSDGVCRATFTYPDGESGPRSYTVSASRPCSGCSNGPTSSPPSAPVVVPVVPGATPSTPGPSDDPQASPSPDGSPGATPGSSGGPSSGPTTAAPQPGATGGSGVADPGAFARSFGAFAPKLGLPKLPPLPEAQAPAVAAPLLPDGTFEDSLDYGDREVEVAPDPGTAAGRGGVLTSTEGPLADEQLVRGVAAALVLVLSGAHLRAWLGRTED
jgi:hypothetical protein